MFPLYQTSGFYAAPVSKALVGGSLLACFGFNLPFAHLRSWFKLTPSALFEELDFLRYLACRCVFLDLKDIIWAAIILYHFRIFERRYGSRKFASLLLCNMCVSLMLELCFMYFIRNRDFNAFPTGPYGIVFSLYVPYYCDIPRVAYTHVMGVPVTGKSLTYVIGLQLLSGSIESLFLAIIGLLSGILVRKNVFWIQNWLRIPKFLAKAFHKTLGWLLYTPPPPEPSTPMGATLEIQRQQQIERLEQQMAWGHLQPRHQGGFMYSLFGINRNDHGGDMNHLNMAHLGPPSDEQIQRLVEMGFNRDNVMNALRASNNDINAATSILLHDT